MSQKVKKDRRIVINKEDKDLDKVLLCFKEDGNVSYYSNTTNPWDLAERLKFVVEFLYENPILIPHICGTKGKPDPHGYKYEDDAYEN
jgi:hypothetical protein